VSLVVRSLPDRIFEILRERIVAGSLPGNDPVRQDAIAQELGVSKIPVREALSRLAQDGLVVSLPNRGWYVRPLSLAEAEDIYALRLSVEPACAGRGALRATTLDQGAVQSAYAALKSAGTRDLTDAAIRNREFHLALIRPDERPLTRQLIERLTLLAERYVVQHLRPSGRGSRAQDEHAQLLDAWLRRDAQAVEARLSAHIQGTLLDLRRQLGC